MRKIRADWKTKLLQAGLTFAGAYLSAVLFNLVLQRPETAEELLQSLFHGRTLAMTFVLLAGALLIGLIRYDKWFWFRRGGKLLSGNEKDREVPSNFEQEHFQTDEELNRNFKRFRYAELSGSGGGIPVRVCMENGDLTVHLAPPAHTLVIGTTGSGKTTMFINPTIQILSETSERPSMLVADPKGELYQLHAQSLRNRGYRVLVLDLRNPFESVKWNPLERPYILYQNMLKLEGEISPEECAYSFQGRKYDTEEELKKAVQVERQRLFDKVYEDLHDIVSVLCPILNKNEPIWESGARNLILAIAIAMLEDSENPELGMTMERYNFYNLMKIATNTEDDCTQLKDYFKGRSELSKSISLSKQVLDSAEKTRGSYISTMFDKLNLFSDMGLCSLTSGNEIDFSELAGEPTVLFLKIPDEKETRYPLASMIVLQAYKQMVEAANLNPRGSLERGVYFLLDEFGNIAPISKIEQMITVGRSRNIWFCLIIQSYSQLARVYDEKIAEIIKSNCKEYVP